MYARIEDTAARLRAAGIDRGDRIGIVCAPCCEVFTLAVACWRIGAAVVPVSTRYPEAKASSAVRAANCKLVIASPAHLQAGRRMINEFAESGCEAGGVTSNELSLDMEAHASIIFTSGSTGEPRGALHTVANHYYSALGSHGNIPFGKEDAWLASLPLYHVSGFSLIMRALIAGGRIVFPQPGESLTEAVMRSDITHLSVVPAQLLRLLEQPECSNRLARLSTILIGGDVIPGKLINWCVEHGLPVCFTYGCTEAASQLATSIPGRPAEGAKLLPYRELKVAVDREILIRGKTLFAGYVEGGGAIDPARDSEGWFHTGDIGRLDESGALHVGGRKDNMFISGGENIHPEEIERMLMSMDAIEQAIVVAIKDRTLGIRPVAFVKTANNLAVNAEAIVAALRERLECFKIPVAIHSWPDELIDAWKWPRKRLSQIASELAATERRMDRL